jgi:glycosyltransferase involved in cell wall biosynthesis
MKRVLFVASLHHPEQLLKEQAATPAGSVPYLFPTSMGQHFWERAMRRKGYAVDVFWRNVPAYSDLTRLKSERHSQRLTPAKIAAAALRRLPPRLNPDLRQRNARLVQHAQAFQPDILWLVGDNTVIYPETLATIKDTTKCQIFYVSGTSPIVFSLPIEREAARLYDLVLVNDYYHGVQWLELGAKRMACLPIAAIDPEFHYPYPLPADEAQRYRCAVTFVGTIVPYKLYSERIAALEALREFDLGVWSVHDVPATLQPHLRGYALGEQMFRILSAATISLNVHGDFMRYGGNMRLFEAAAVGAFQLSDDRPGIAQWFTPNQHLVLYRDLQDLRDKTAYYLAHPAERERIAQAALAHVRQYHTYDQRLAQVEQLLRP